MIENTSATVKRSRSPFAYTKVLVLFLTAALIISREVYLFI